MGHGRHTKLTKHARRGTLKTLMPRSGIIGALASTAALGLTAAATMGLTSFSAQVGGTGTFHSGTLLLSDTNGTGTCLSSANSAGSISTNINAACAGDDLSSGTTNEPGGAVVVATDTLTNQGSIASVGGLALATGACSAASDPYAGSALNPLSSGSDTSAGYCGVVLVTVENETGTVSCLFPAGAGACPAPAHANGTLATLASKNITLVSSLAAGASEVIKIRTQLDNAAGTGATNVDQGLAGNMSMTYTLSQ